MVDNERKDAPDPDAEDSAGAGNGADKDDTEGQALTWKVRKPIPEAAEDTEGQSLRPPPEQAAGLTGPAIGDEEDDAEGHGDGTGLPLPHVD
jgi:hypothetical protein